MTSLLRAIFPCFILMPIMLNASVEDYRVANERCGLFRYNPKTKRLGRTKYRMNRISNRDIKGTQHPTRSNIIVFRVQGLRGYYAGVASCFEQKDSGPTFVASGKSFLTFHIVSLTDEASFKFENETTINGTDYAGEDFDISAFMFAVGYSLPFQFVGLNLELEAGGMFGKSNWTGKSGLITSWDPVNLYGAYGTLRWMEPIAENVYLGASIPLSYVLFPDAPTPLCQGENQDCADNEKLPPPNTTIEGGFPVRVGLEFNGRFQFDPFLINAHVGIYRFKSLVWGLGLGYQF